MSHDHNTGLSLTDIQQFMADSFPHSRSLAITAATTGQATVCMQSDSKHLRPGNTVSGPTLMTMADSAMYIAILASYSNGAQAVTSQLNMHFLNRPAAGSTLQATAKLIKMGKKNIVGDVDIYTDIPNMLVAKASVTYMLANK